MSEVHALGLSMCCGGGTQIKDSESGREEGTLDTLIRRERRMFGMERNEGGKEDIWHCLGVYLSTFAS